MQEYIVTVNGKRYEVSVEKKSEASAVKAPAEPEKPAVNETPAKLQSEVKKESAASAGSVKVNAGVAGKVFKIAVSAGQSVKAGDSIVVLEAMKMEIPVVAPKDGVVASVNCKEGDAVEAGMLLATLE